MQKPFRRDKRARRVMIAALALVMIAAAPVFVTRLVGAQPTAAPAETGTASNDGLEISVKAAFGRLEINSWGGVWVPFRITLINQGPAVTGRLIVHTESNNNGPTGSPREFVKDIQLPTGANQSHEIVAFLNSG